MKGRTKSRYPSSNGGGKLFIGTAGWCIPRGSAHRFEVDGTHLQRYARVLRCAEINSSFYRPHAAATYAKWAASTPQGFRFALKIPRVITHEQKLRRARLPLERFLRESAGLGKKRGPLLVQLPPSLAFDTQVAARFFVLLRQRYGGSVVCEPRHDTWFSAAAEALLVRYRVARVAADPPVAPGAERPGGWNRVVYFRLHGSPRKYWSRYADGDVEALARTLCAAAASAEAWCVFDNTASGAALENAWDLHSRTSTGIFLAHTRIGRGTVNKNDAPEASLSGERTHMKPQIDVEAPPDRDEHIDDLVPRPLDQPPAATDLDAFGEDEDLADEDEDEDDEDADDGTDSAPSS